MDNLELEIKQKKDLLAKFIEIIKKYNVKKTDELTRLVREMSGLNEIGFSINDIVEIFELEIAEISEKQKSLENDKFQSELPLIIEFERSLMNRLNEALERNKAEFIFKYLVADMQKLEEIFKKMKQGKISTLCLELLSNLTFEDVLLDNKILDAVLENKTEIIANNIYLYHGCAVYTEDGKLVKFPFSYELEPALVEYKDGKYENTMLDSGYSVTYTLEEIVDNYVSLDAVLEDAESVMKKELYGNELDLQYQVNPKSFGEKFAPKIAKLFEKYFISLKDGKIGIRQTVVPLVKGYHKSSEKKLSHDEVIEEFLKQNNIEIKRIGKNTNELSR